MRYIEIRQIGRGTPDPLRYPVLPGRDETALIAQELEWYVGHGAVVTPVYGTENAYAVWCDPHAIIGNGAILRIAVVDGEPPVQPDDTQELVPAIPVNEELLAMYRAQQARQMNRFGG